MALPSNVGKGTINIRLIESTGAPARGDVYFTPEFRVLKNTTASPKTLILPKAVKVTLNSNGVGSAILAATNDPDNNPRGWTYRVTANLEGEATLDPFSFSVPEGSVQDLADVQPLITSEGHPTVVGPGVPHGGLAGQVLIKESNADYDTAWADYEGGGGGGAVDSVNGQTGVVVLSAADVNARPSSYVPTWDQILNKPTTFPPSTITGMPVYVNWSGSWGARPTSNPAVPVWWIGGPSSSVPANALVGDVHLPDK